jgi:hypothetical protein
VVDEAGRLVKTLIDGNITAGEHEIVFDASRLPAGIYYYTLIADNRRKTASMVVSK